MEQWYDPYDWNDFSFYYKGRDVYLFGAAETAERFLNDEDIEIKGIFDNHKAGQIFHGVMVDKPEKMKIWDFDSIVIVITCQFYDAVVKQLKEYGVKYFFHYERCSANKGVPNVSVEEILELSCERQMRGDVFDKYKCYAHALGAMDDTLYTNSLEAFEKSYKNGFRVFEADTSFTEEGELILCHPITYICRMVKGEQRLIENIFNTLDRRGIPRNFQTYSEEKVFGKYTPLKFIDWIMKMKEYPSIYYVTHARGGKTLEQYKQMVSICKELDESILERFIIQVHDERMYREIVDIYPFRYITLLPNRKPIRNVLLLALRLNVRMVTLEKNRISDELIELCSKVKLKLCVYNLDEEEKAQDLIKKGISLLCMETNPIVGDGGKV